MLRFVLQIIELKSGLDILLQFSYSGDIEDISEGDSDW